MAVSHKGACPYCLSIIRPSIIEKNRWVRDKCQCPKCDEIIYACRNPLCNDYAEGGDFYDDELCPKCFNRVSQSIKNFHDKMLEQQKHKNKDSYSKES